jgi:hypothetical protein
VHLRDEVAPERDEEDDAESGAEQRHEEDLQEARQVIDPEPPAMMPEVAPMATMLTFSSRVLLRRASAERPTARMAIGMAGSMPWPNLSAMKDDAPENSTPIRTPMMIERIVTSATRRAGETTGT